MPKTTQNWKLGLLMFSALPYTKLSTRNNLVFLDNEGLTEVYKQPGQDLPLQAASGLGANEVTSCGLIFPCKKKKMLT